MSETFIEGDLAVIELFASDALKTPESKYSLKLYSYKTAEDYYNALKDYTDSGKLKIGSEVTVDINVKGGGYHIITDVIPSCGRSDKYSNFKSQRITIYTDRYGHASYTFIIAADGEYVLESAAALNRSSGEWGMSDRTVIKVEGYETTV